MPQRFAPSDARTSRFDSTCEGSLPQDPGQVVIFRRRELLGLPIFAFGVFLALGLLTFRRDPLDPTVAGANWVGPVGESLCGWVIQGFGVVAWLLPVELMLFGVALLRSRELRGMGFRLTSDLILGILLSAIVQILFPEATAFAAMHASGNVGWLFGELGRGLFSGLGTLLLATTIAALLLIGRSPYSFVEACERIVSVSNRLLMACWGLLRRTHVAWNRAHALRQAQLAAQASDNLPHIDLKPSDEAIIAELTDEDCDLLDCEAEASAPIVVSRNLRSSLSATADTLLDTVTPAAAAVKATQGSVAATNLEAEPGDDEPEPEFEIMPLRSVPKVSRKQSATEPRIIDTRPAQLVTRAPRAVTPK